MAMKKKTSSASNAAITSTGIMRLSSKESAAHASNSAPDTPVINVNDTVAALKQANDFLIRNDSSLFRRDLLTSLLNTKTDLNKECGYPDYITPEMYFQLYDREGLAQRVVHCMAEESWVILPEVYETEDEGKTAFENDLEALCLKHDVWNTLKRADMLSGIGRFGAILLGINDGRPFIEPVDTSGAKLDLIFLTVLHEPDIKISSTDRDETSPRYGQPLVYSVNYYDEATGSSISGNVHYSRIIHLADNRRTSQVYGTPRMKAVFNRLLDVRKIISGSPEMFWKGAFPGFGLKIDPDQQGAQIDIKSVRTEFERYSSGLQRYMALEGMSVQSIAPQVSDPSSHIMVQMDNIAITLTIPKRILFGSEMGVLASGQDAKAWNKRLSGRQEGYVTPQVIRPFIDRVVQFGIISSPKKTDIAGRAEYITKWKDLNTMTDGERADISVKDTDCLAAYVTDGIESLIPLKEYLVKFLGRTSEEADALVKARDEGNGLDMPSFEDEEDSQGAHHNTPTMDVSESEDETTAPADLNPSSEGTPAAGSLIN